MKKVGLAFFLVLCLVFGSAVWVMADSGFHIGLGYEQLNTTVTLEPSLSVPLDLTLDVGMPCKMLTLDLGYDFSDNFGINGKYSWGSTDVVKVNGGISGTSFDLPVSMDNNVWRIEGVYKFPVGDRFKIGAVLGYLDSDTKLKAKFAATGEPTYDGNVDQKYYGVYAGVLGEFKLTDNFELGASFRYLINPSGSAGVSVTENGSPNLITPNTVPLNDFTAYFLDVYGKAALTANWTAEVGYTYSYADYSLAIPNSYIPAMDVTNKTSGLWVKMVYKF